MSSGDPPMQFPGDESAPGPDLVIEDPTWSAVVDDIDELLSTVFLATIAAEPKTNGSFSVLLADDSRVSALNAEFRGKPSPTNVLSFPSGFSAPNFIGDLALARETCEREANEQGKQVTDHVAHLLVHGLLHLIGYDHLSEDEALAMEQLEIRILDQLGIANPYEQSSSLD
ncbi:MAG: rRNA maturation RNase YbeY [Pseudomonadota bacterium]